jgi:hypothetical protein
MMSDSFAKEILRELLDQMIVDKIEVVSRSEERGCQSKTQEGEEVEVESLGHHCRTIHGD